MTIKVEELLEIVGSSIPARQKKDSKNLLRVKEFVRDARIKHGDTKVGCTIIYSRYLRYAKGTVPLSFRRFFICFSQLFMRYRTNTVRYYKLDPNSFSFPQGYDVYKAYETEAVHKAKKPSSEYKYVYFNKINKKWDVIVRDNKKLRRLGSFKTEVEAAMKVKQFLEAGMSKEIETK